MPVVYGILGIGIERYYPGRRTPRHNCLPSPRPPPAAPRRPAASRTASPRPTPPRPAALLRPLPHLLPCLAPSRPWGIRVLDSTRGIQCVRASGGTSTAVVCVVCGSKRKVGPWTYSPACPRLDLPSWARPGSAWPVSRPAPPQPASPCLGWPGSAPAPWDVRVLETTSLIAIVR